MKPSFQNKIRAFFFSVSRLFTPPFEGLPIVMWCYFVLAYMGSIHNPIWHGDLPDPDDYTYLSQTLDWLHGQNWYDNTQHRMDPPLDGVGGVPIHYTRFAEMPIAIGILFFKLFHYSDPGAAILASLALPILYLGVFFASVRWTAAQMMTSDWARLTVFISVFANALMFKFAPGQVDHHGLEAILTILSLGLTFRMLEEPSRKRYAIGLGALLALMIGIALETLPWMALTSVLVGFWGLITGRKATKTLTLYALSLSTVSALLLIAIRPVIAFFTIDILAYSFAYVALCLSMTFALLIAAVVGQISERKVRVGVGGLTALLVGGLYLWQFPELLGGPYGAMNHELANLFFANLQEAEPMIKGRSLYDNILRLVPCFIAFWSSYKTSITKDGAQKWGWALTTILLATAILLAVFYQVRVIIYALLFSIIPLTIFFKERWEWIGMHLEERQKFWSEIVLLLIIGPLTAVLLPALKDGRSFNNGVILFAAQKVEDSCPMSGLEKILSSPPFVSLRPLRIVNAIDQGPELLFRTPQAIMSAPYHTNVHGNLDALTFFRTTDIGEAKGIADRDHIDLVVICRNVADVYLDGPSPHYVLFPDGQKRLRPNASLAGKLAFHELPNWLTEVPVPPTSNYMLFRVKTAP